MRSRILLVTLLLGLAAPRSALAGDPPPDGGSPAPAAPSNPALPDGGAVAPGDGGLAAPAGPTLPDGGGPAPPVETAAPPAQPPARTGVPFGGRVLRKGDRVPIPGAVVVLDEGDPSTVTDGEGRFTFESVPPGKHVVAVRGPGIDSVRADETLPPDKRLDVTYYVSAKVRYRSTVRGARPTREVVEHTLDVEEIKRIPGTQGDVLKAVQNLPGVARAAFGGGALVVWGSNPADTRVYVDGVSIPYLYHFGGLRSTVQSEVVNELTFTPGGYGTEFGRGMGGLVEIATKAPRTDGYHGFVQLDIIDGSFLVQGPITKNLSFSVSARRSWIDAFLPIFTSSDFQLSPKYWDYTARLQWRASARDTVSFFFFGSDDSVEILLKTPDPKLSAAFNTHTYYHRMMGTWTHRFDGGATLTVTPSTGYAVPFNFSAQIGNYALSVDARRTPYDLRVTLRQPLSELVRLDAGIDFEGNRFGLSAHVPTGSQPREGSQPPMTFASGVLDGTGDIYTHGLAPWAALHLTDEPKRLDLTLGLRLESFFLSGSYDFPGAPAQVQGHGSFSHAYFTPEARASVRYQLVRWLWAKAAFGYYHQAPNPGDLFGPFGNPDVHPMSATHWVAGFDAKPTDTLTISVDGFYKQIFDQVVRGKSLSDPPLSNDGVGRVYGGELLLRQQLWKGLFGWVSYTVSRAERKDHPDEDWRLFQFDQTHILTAIASYQFGRGYQVGVRFRYVTGNPYTPYVGSYIDLNFGNYIPLFGPTYSARLGSFNQLDVRFDKTWEFRLWKLSLYVDIQNLYNAKNPEGYQPNYDFSEVAPVSGLPIFPALGLRGDF